MRCYLSVIANGNPAFELSLLLKVPLKRGLSQPKPSYYALFLKTPPHHRPPPPPSCIFYVGHPTAVFRDRGLAKWQLDCFCTYHWTEHKSKILMDGHGQEQQMSCICVHIFFYEKCTLNWFSFFYHSFAQKRASFFF